MNKTTKRSKVLIGLWLTISIWGIINVFSASYINLILLDTWPYATVVGQVILVILAAITLQVILSNNKKFYQLLRTLIKPMFYVSLISLFLVLVPYIGSGRGGASSVINLYIIDYQPLELYKITMILYMADYLANDKRIRSIQSLLKLSFLIGMGMFLIFLEPDLGGMIICFSVFFIMLLLNGEYIGTIIRYSLFILIILIILAVLLYSLGLIYPYQIARITSWVNPFSDPLNTGYHTINSIIAISNGGIFGEGYMNSIQKTGFLPNSDTDYIFAIICEEWGAFGMLFTIALIISIAMIVINVGLNAYDRFGMLYCYGYSFLILVQAFINIGGVTGFIPETGVTLPFISNGLNSYLFLSAGIFIVLMIDKDSHQKRKKKHERTSALFM